MNSLSSFRYMWHSFREWYVAQPVGKSSLIVGAIGLTCGYFYGKHDWKHRQIYEFCDSLQVTQFNLPRDPTSSNASPTSDNTQSATPPLPSALKSFENTWNEVSLPAQKQEGYQWTKLYKSRDWKSPIDYLEFRLWRDDESFSKWQKEKGESNEEALRTVSGATVSHHLYTCVIDDTVRRIVDI